MPDEISREKLEELIDKKASEKAKKEIEEAFKSHGKKEGGKRKKSSH